MNYEQMAQNALRGVVRMALERVAKQGLPGDHHFYITFESQYPGVVMSDWLKERYPDEMTIVLQHQFWGLNIDDDAFQISLKFHKIDEALNIPFAAVKAFFDPSVQFMLQFKPVAGQAPRKPVGVTEQPVLQPLKPTTRTDAPAAGDDDGDKPKDPSGGGGEVVSLDKFRKK